MRADHGTTANSNCTHRRRHPVVVRSKESVLQLVWNLPMTCTWGGFPGTRTPGRGTQYHVHMPDTPSLITRPIDRESTTRHGVRAFTLHVVMAHYILQRIPFLNITIKGCEDFQSKETVCTAIWRKYGNMIRSCRIHSFWWLSPCPECIVMA